MFVEVMGIVVYIVIIVLSLTKRSWLKVGFGIIAFILTLLIGPVPINGFLGIVFTILIAGVYWYILYFYVRDYLSS